MKAIKIDAEYQDVYEIEMEGGLQSYYDAIGCNTIERVAFSDDHDLVIDEEGLINGTTKGFYFGSSVFYGSGVIVQSTPDGDWVSHNLQPAVMDILKKKVQWFVNM